MTARHGVCWRVALSALQLLASAKGSRLLCRIVQDLCEALRANVQVVNTDTLRCLVSLSLNSPKMLQTFFCFGLEICRSCARARRERQRERLARM